MDRRQQGKEVISKQWIAQTRGRQGVYQANNLTSADQVIPD